MSTANSPIRILFAAGGTAGHIEPALAVADAIKRINPLANCEFIGTEAGLEQTLIPKRGYRIMEIRKVVLPRTFSLAILAFPFRLVASAWTASRYIRGADAVVGFGGYVSAPAYLAALLRRIPIIIHEANAKPGWANRLGRRFADVVAVNFSNVARSWPDSILTGMPIRESISELASLSASERFKIRESKAREWGFDTSRPIIAVFGGSQGSQHINSVIAEFIQSDSSDLQIIHALGMNNQLPDGRPGYLPLPYFHDMAAIYGSADLMISRSGAVTCAELMTVGRHAILVPLPHGNGEQHANARQLAELGIAQSVANEEFTAKWLHDNLAEAVKVARQSPTKSHDLHIGAADRLAELVLRAGQ